MVILAAGLTPAWQQILVFPRFVPGEVNRAAEAVWCASGKVLNVGCAVHHLLHDSSPVPSPPSAGERVKVRGTSDSQPVPTSIGSLSVDNAQSHTLCLIGGSTGGAVQRDFAALNIPATWIETTVPTRVCTTILDRATGETTELVQNSGAVTSDDLERFAAAFAKLSPRADLVVLTGSLPEGTPTDYYRRLMASVRVPVLLDIRGAELRDCLLQRPWLVKPNREELAATVGRPLTTDDEVLAAMHELHASGAQHVVVSDGPRALWALGPNGVERFVPPNVDVVNPIGCGDCLAAGLAVVHVEGRPWRECVQFGMNAATENARQLLPGRISRPAIEPR